MAVVTSINRIPRPRPKPRFALVAEDDIELDGIEDSDIEKGDMIEVVDGFGRKLDEDTEVEVPVLLTVNVRQAVEVEANRWRKTCWTGLRKKKTTRRIG